MAILGDMFELGAAAESFHEQIGGLAAKLGINRVVFMGSQARAYRRGYLGAGGAGRAVTVVNDNEEAWQAIRKELELYGAILVKGSRKMKMETLADRIAEEI